MVATVASRIMNGFGRRMKSLRVSSIAASKMESQMLAAEMLKLWPLTKDHDAFRVEAGIHAVVVATVDRSFYDLVTRDVSIFINFSVGVTFSLLHYGTRYLYFNMSLQCNLVK